MKNKQLFRLKLQHPVMEWHTESSVWEEKKRPQQGLTTIIGIQSAKLRDSQQQRELQTSKKMSVKDLTI
jgi:hypothetical protein